MGTDRGLLPQADAWKAFGEVSSQGLLQLLAPTYRLAGGSLVGLPAAATGQGLESRLAQMAAAAAAATVRLHLLLSWKLETIADVRHGQ